MAEIVGVAASAITLAALFSSCIECFSYFKAAQNCPKETESLLVKLDCEKARLLVWANTVGILQTDPHKRNPVLADVQQDVLIRRCVDQIITLLTDARKLQDEYGGRATNEQESQRYLAVLSVNSMNVFQATKRTFFARVGTKGAMPSLFSRIKWAIRDAAKFRVLLLSLRDFVDSLIQLVPVPPETISNIVEEDIVSTVDIQNLRLIEEGCDEDCYPHWSARASEAIRDSEDGTVDRRNLLEILRDTEGIQQGETTLPRSQTVSEVKYSNASFRETFIVLTEKCLNHQAGSNSHCAESRIGKAVSGPDHSNSFTSSGVWTLGRRLYNHLELPWDMKEKLEQHQELRLEHMKIHYDEPPVEKLIRVFVYCGACACAINTARMLATDGGLPKHVEVVIRVDERLATSCRSLSDVSNTLEAIWGVVQNVSANTWGLDAIDCPELEKKIYDLEQEQHEQVESESMLQNLLLKERPRLRGPPYTSGVVIIAENDICADSLSRAPIYSHPRKPRAGELYKFVEITTRDIPGYDMVFVGRLNKSQAWMDYDEAQRQASRALDDGAAGASQPSIASTSRKRSRSDSTAS